jgi:hypothetical protein
MLSQFLTLYTTPVIYLYLDRLERWAVGRFRRSRELRPAAPEPALP